MISSTNLTNKYQRRDTLWGSQYSKIGDKYQRLDGLLSVKFEVLEKAYSTKRVFPSRRKATHGAFCNLVSEISPCKQSAFWVYKEGNSAGTYASLCELHCYRVSAYAEAVPTQKSPRGLRGLRRHTLPSYAAPGATKQTLLMLRSVALSPLPTSQCNEFSTLAPQPPSWGEVSLCTRTLKR